MQRLLLFSGAAFAAVLLSAGTVSAAAVTELPSAAPPGVSAMPSPQPAKVRVRGVVLQVNHDEGAKEQIARVKITDGGFENRDVVVTQPEGSRDFVPLEAGDTVTMRAWENPNGSLQAELLEPMHRFGLFMSILITLALLAFFGRRVGVFELVMAAVGVLLVLFFTIPLIKKGVSPAVAALLTAAIGTALLAALSFGLSRRAYATAAGSFLTLLLSLGLARLYFGLTDLTSNSDPISSVVVGSIPDITVQSLHLAMFILAATGSFFYMCQRITAAVFLDLSLHPDHDMRPLLDVGVTKGRELLATISTAVLWTILGAALPVLLFAVHDISVFQVHEVGIAVARGILFLALMSGMVLAVPVATVLASVFALSSRR